MGRDAASPHEGEDFGRDTRLKIVLLAVALFLVVGYASALTDFGELTRASVGNIGSLPLASAAGVLLLAAAGAAILLFRRRQAAAAATPSEDVDSPPAPADRREFLERLTAQVDAHAKSGRQLALHLVDVDRFRLVNTILGEAQGDRFLCMLAERLLVLVGQPDRLARIGDDEFAILQPEAGGARHAEIYARRIQETLKDVCAQLPRHARPGASIGIAVSGEHATDAARLLHSAALALDAAKSAGGDTFRLYAREMEMAIESRLQMESAISDGLHQGWFEVHFQPKYDLRTSRLTGFEALVRMNHPELGEQLPEVFLPIAEESGLIQPLGEWVIREALAIAAEWPSHLALALNISPAQLRHGDIAGVILGAAARSGFDPARLQVEISEDALIEERGVTGDQLRRLRTRGVTIVLDDFGLAASRLGKLSNAACDAVKIDRSLVERVGEEPETEMLVRSLIGAARSFDLGVRAEGVERVEQAHFLVSHACDQVQGFLFGRPAPACELAVTIAKDMRKMVPRPPDRRAPHTPDTGPYAASIASSRMSR